MSEQFPHYDDDLLGIKKIGETLKKVGHFSLAIILYLALAPYEVFQKIKQKKD